MGTTGDQPSPADQLAGSLIAGLVENGGQKMGHSGSIIGILYGAEGKPLDVSQTYAKLQPVALGQTVPRGPDFPKAGSGQHAVYLPG